MRVGRKDLGRYCGSWGQAWQELGRVKLLNQIKGPWSRFLLTTGELRTALVISKHYTFTEPERLPKSRRRFLQPRTRQAVAAIARGRSAEWTREVVKFTMRATSRPVRAPASEHRAYVIDGSLTQCNLDHMVSDRLDHAVHAPFSRGPTASARTGNFRMPVAALRALKYGALDKTTRVTPAMRERTDRAMSLENLDGHQRRANVKLRSPPQQLQQSGRHRELRLPRLKPYRTAPPPQSMQYVV